MKRLPIGSLMLLVMPVMGFPSEPHLNPTKPLVIRDLRIPPVTPSLKALKPTAHMTQSPGTVIDSTYYDWQANGGLDDRMAMFDEDGTVEVNAVWLVAHQKNFLDRCLTAYYCWDIVHGVDPPEGFCLIPPRGGGGSLAPTPDGRLVACSTGIIDSLGSGGAVAIVDAFPCMRAFTYLSTSADTVGLWPRITYNSDGTIVMTGTATEAFGGIGGHVMWTKSGDWHLFGEIAPDWMHDNMEPATIHSGENGRVGVVIPDYAGAVRYFESTDNGESFLVHTIVEADTADLPSGLDSTAARLGWINSDITFIGEEPHVVWSAGQGAKFNGGYGILDFKSTIFHWSPSTGVDTVVVARAQSADNTRVDYVQAPWNHLSVDWPSIGLATDGNTLVCAFTALDPMDVDSISMGPVGPNVGYLDVWMAASDDNGSTWSDPINVTNPDRTLLGWDDRYPSIAKVSLENPADPGKDVYLVYQTDDRAGTLVQGTEGALNVDYVKFMGVDLPMVGIGNDGEGGSVAGLPRAVSLSQNRPNPFNPSTTIAYTLPTDSHVAIKVYDVRGRLVCTLVDRAENAGAHEVRWDGKDGSGGEVPSGVYLYSIETDRAVRSARKMVLFK